MEIKTKKLPTVFVQISAHTCFEFDKAPVEPDNFNFAGQVCLAIVNFFISNDRPFAIKKIGATFFGHESVGTQFITFHISVDLGMNEVEKIVIDKQFKN